MENMTKEEVESLRKSLLEEYHSKKEEIEFAENDIEEGWIEEELEAYRTKIRACVAKIKEMDSSEDQQPTSLA